MKDLYQLTYSSTAISVPDTKMIAEILQTARRNNQALNVTGVLLHKDGHFIQVLEGYQTAVKALFARIVEDPRHFNVKKLQEDVVKNRVFQDWRMGFADIDGKELHTLYGAYHLLGGFRFDVIKNYLESCADYAAKPWLLDFIQHGHCGVTGIKDCVAMGTKVSLYQ